MMLNASSGKNDQDPDHFLHKIFPSRNNRGIRWHLPRENKRSGFSGDCMKNELSNSGENRAVSWVSTEWLLDHLRDPGLIVLDVRPDAHSYFAGHIPGSLLLHEAHLRSHIGGNPVRWIGPEAAENLFGTLGIETDTPVVVCSGNVATGEFAAGSGDGIEQYLAAYTLVRFGCRRVFILDGGLNRWVAEKRPLERRYGVSQFSTFRSAVRTEFLISLDECARLKNDPNAVLLDVRLMSGYEGQGPWMKPGHIPGAVNLPFRSLLSPDNPGQILSEPELREVFASCGVTPDKTIICSCGTGRNASIAFLILKWFLGYPEVLMFEGGFTEWVSNPDNPVVVGKNPR